jgi:hypothetical protein
MKIVSVKRKSKYFSFTYDRSVQILKVFLFYLLILFPKEKWIAALIVPILRLNVITKRKVG